MYGTLMQCYFVSVCISGNDVGEKPPSTSHHRISVKIHMHG